MRIVASCLACLLLTGLSYAEEPVVPAKGEARLLRFPTIHDNRIVFTYAGDLYTVPADGGIARRLTNHEGFEMFAHFSPDGKWLAFTGQYDGNTEVYLMPSEGGVPKRLTWTATLGRDDVSDRMGPNNIVMGWKHDGKSIVFRSRMQSFNDFLGQLYTVPLEGGWPEPLPLPRGGFCSFSPDDSKLAYNRVFREFRTWKRYRGGMADNVWVHDFKTKETVNLTEDDSQNIFPMWHGDKIYFLSDRGPNKRMNLYSIDPREKKSRQLTHFSDFDIKFPTLGDKAIVFENGGWIYRYDLAGDKAVRVPIKILEDRAAARGGLLNVARNVTNFEISPDGKRALFGARGDVFTVPAKNGPTRNLTNTPGVHERNSKWSPDGKLIAFVSDATGEDEIHVMPPDGKEAAKQLTTGADTYKYEILWSPDSKKILWTDKKNRVQYVEVATKKITTVMQSKVWETHDVVWSPDSKWIAFSEEEMNNQRKVYLYEVEKGKNHEVTDEQYSSFSPAFSGDGKYLFFVSNRDFNPIYSATEWNVAYRDMARIYFVTLAKETPSPFRPKSDESGETPKAEEAAKKDAPIKIDLDGLKDRVLALPVQAANYGQLTSVGSSLYYIRSGSRDARPAFLLYDLAAKKETSLGTIGGYEISADGKKMLVVQDAKYAIIDLPRGPVNLGEALDLSGMEMIVDHAAEWQEIYNECWRQMRDFFFDPNMHGVDWPAMKKKYEPLVPYVNHRADLTYVIGEMIGELNVGHAYVGGGDMPRPQRVTTGLLGAKLTRDPTTGYYHIDKILKGANWDPKLRSPLAEPGVNVRDGEYILAVDGKPANEMTSLYEATVNKAGKQVTLRVNGEAKATGARDIVVVPISDEAALYYRNWVNDNMKKVNDATAGKVGYIHVPDMQVAGLNEFTRQFYPQITKKALIIDVRGNGGGNVSPMLIERLRREAVMIDIARNGAPHVDPQAMVWGPMLCLMNEFSASDGDLFPYRFKQHKIGPLVGKRSWGGVVGIRGSLPLLDGGYMNRPEFSRYDLEGKSWVIEGHGVDPDVVVDNDPSREYAGEDDQLNRAVKMMLEELKTKEKTIPPAPVGPKK